MVASNKRIQTIVVLSKDSPGILAGISDLIAQTEHNILSLSVGPSETKNFARFTILVSAQDDTDSHLTEKIGELDGVIRVEDITDENRIEHEFALIKIRACSSERADVMTLVRNFKANVKDIGPQTLTVAIEGDGNKLYAFIKLLGDRVIVVKRSGVVAMIRGEASPELATPNLS